jgi:hypothetical protein
VVERRTLNVAPAGAATHALRPTLAYFQGSGWSPEAIVAALTQASGVLAQCGVRVDGAELVAVEAPRTYHLFETQRSRHVARALDLPKPTVYFVADTRQQPAFDAEAIGRGNSRTRPELADTVWVTRGTRDLGIALAHELAHVLMDDGTHAADAGNLMREETGPGNTRLSATQCTRLRDKASGNGLLRPLRAGAN